jgi:hypothetical protein
MNESGATATPPNEKGLEVYGGGLLGFPAVAGATALARRVLEQLAEPVR